MRQLQALNVMMSGENVFLTGAPGAGKTYVLNQFVQRAMRTGKRIAVTASTGIAASHIGGTTIHSWSGLGILDNLTNDDLKKFGGSDRLVKRYNSIDTLVIDEVSMLHGARLDMVNQLAKVLRGNDEPFGGLQIILVGDLFQLPPINRLNNDFDFVYKSNAWHELQPKICYLTEQHRQQGNDALLELLEAMRSDSLEEEHGRLLQERISIEPVDITVTRLYAHNVDVDEINHRQLALLPGKSKRFEMHTKGSKAKIEQLSKSLLAPDILELKVGAEVMFVANNFAEGFVNGSRGKVVDFVDDMPVVRLLNGKTIYVSEHSWSLSEDGRVRAEINQLPLRLAWAITIHKSQGMSLDAAEIDLGKTFTPGMGYVALSRVRSLQGLYLLGLNPMALKMHPEIHEIDKQFHNSSSLISQQFNDISKEDFGVKPKSALIDEELYEKLKAWRYKRAKSDKLPPFMIAHNTALSAVAANIPLSSQQLMTVPGFGARKVEVYGPDILAITTAHLEK